MKGPTQYHVIDQMLDPREPCLWECEQIRVPDGDPLLTALRREHGCRDLWGDIVRFKR